MSFGIKVLDKVLQPLKVTGTRQHHKYMGRTYVPEVQGLGVIEFISHFVNWSQNETVYHWQFSEMNVMK